MLARANPSSLRVKLHVMVKGLGIVVYTKAQPESWSTGGKLVVCKLYGHVRSTSRIELGLNLKHGDKSGCMELCRRCAEPRILKESDQYIVSRVVPYIAALRVLYLTGAEHGKRDLIWVLEDALYALKDIM